MEKKIKDPRFDRAEPDADTSDECFTTDLSDLEADQVYRRYKLLQREAKEDHRQLESKIEEFKLAIKNQKVLQKGDKKAQRPWRELEKELYVKQFNTGMYISQIEQRIAEARQLSLMKKMNPSDILVDKDGNSDPFIGDEFFNPHERLPEEIKNDKRLPAEV